MSLRLAAAVTLWIALGSSAHAQVDMADMPPPAFKPPPVSDPMLEPPAPVGREVHSWDEALSLIRAHSPDYLTGFQSVLRARAQSRVALAAVLPVLNGQLSHIHQYVTAKQTIGDDEIESPPGDVVGAGVTLSWPIVNPRGIWGIGTAKRNAEVAKLAFEDQRRQIAIVVVDAMLSTLAAARVADLNRVGLRSALERQVLTQTRLQYGQGTTLDLERAQQDVAAARAQVLAGDEELRQAGETLGVTLGSEVPFTTSQGLDLEAFEQAVARTCRLNADLEARPDVAAARKRVEVADRAISDAELMFVPSINVLSQVNRATAVTLGPLTTWSLQGILSVPLYDGGIRYAALRDTRAAAEQARQALVRTRVNAIVSAARAARAVSVLQASRDVAAQQRDLARSIDARTREGYARGFGTSLDLVLSAQALRQAETNLVLLEFQVGQARAGAVLANAECVF